MTAGTADAAEGNIMCFICRVLLALALTRVVVRLVLYGLGVVLLAVLAQGVRVALLRDGLVVLGTVGAVLVASAIASWGAALIRRGGRRGA
ncbi:hypothetical protein [Streptomyces decoyicus]|uniref:hypothetical protein n=1 Tax=Streptomyces decoyicus TaxID=249567 RepID=UPI00364F2044